ncbi:uncharacterized protein [Rutidosis leptorrhynchoides]|uniref:uncharacterized protein n=1 Tax=Rutidosis leptorrhynchoides TaxID=125765 RepID=UPI003A98CF51
MLKQLHINISLVEALELISRYTKFMKSLMSKQRKLLDGEIVEMAEECIAIIKKKLLPKLKDPGRFTVPCKIGNFSTPKALCDLGATINLMPLSVYEKLGLGEYKSTNVILQLADRIMMIGSTPVILGRAFLATGKALVDVDK